MKQIMRGMEIAAVLVLVAGANTGCSIIGLGVGLNEDDNPSDTLAVVPSRANDLRRGAWVQVFLKDSSRVEGEFVGRNTHPDTSFPRLYQAWRAQCAHQKLFPAIGDTVKINETAHGPWTDEGIFLGFDVGVICLQKDDGVERTPLRMVVSMISRDGTYLINPSELINTQDTLSPPLRSSLLIRCDRDTLCLPLATVRQIRTPAVTNKWGIHFLAGAAIDALVVYMLASSIKPLNFSRP